MKIGLIQHDDTQSVLSSSGTLYFMARALEEHVGEVVHLGPNDGLSGRLLILAGRSMNTVSYALFRRRVSPIHHRLLSWNARRVFGPRVDASGCDVLFAPFSSVEIAALRTTIPIVYHTDMTWANALEYYEIFSSLHDFSQKEGERIQRAAFRNASVSFFPSDWATKSAVEHYHVDPAKVSTVPYGANFAEEDVPLRVAALKRSLEHEVQLLWIGVNWERKGGVIAYECLMELLRQGVAARLTLCGCSPPGTFAHEKVTVEPFLDKSDPKQRGRLSQLYLSAHFFLFPTTTEALGIVLCEAAAHGLPSLVRRTGGVCSVIAEGVNGYLLPPEARGREYAEKIVETLADPSLYSQLVRTSRDSYESRLNWSAWARAVKPIFARCVSQNKPR